MPKIWDDKLKRLFAMIPQDFVHWLLPGAKFIRMVPLELKTLTRAVHADALCEVEIHGQKALVHIEFQKYADSDMAERVWEYNVLATLQDKCPVYSFIIYLLPVGKIPEPPFTRGLEQYEAVHTFRFKNIKLQEMSVDSFRKMGMKGLLPLCMLTEDGARREVAEEVFDSVGERKDLLNLAFGLASMVLTSESDQSWLERKVTMLEEILRDTWYFKRIMTQGLEEGRQQGIQQGIEQGLEQGKVQVAQEMLISIIRMRFPSLAPLVKSHVEAIKNVTILEAMVLQMVSAQTAEEAQKIIQQAYETDE